MRDLFMHKKVENSPYVVSLCKTTLASLGLLLCWSSCFVIWSQLLVESSFPVGLRRLPQEYVMGRTCVSPTARTPLIF